MTGLGGRVGRHHFQNLSEVRCCYWCRFGAYVSAELWRVSAVRLMLMQHQNVASADAKICPVECTQAFDAVTGFVKD